MLNRQRHIDQWQLLERLAASGWESEGGDQFVKRFVYMAEGLGRATDATRALHRLVDFPECALSPADDGNGRYRSIVFVKPRTVASYASRWRHAGCFRVPLWQ